MAKNKTEVKKLSQIDAASNAVDYTKPGFSNVKPGSPQAEVYKRLDALPSQLANKVE